MTFAQLLAALASTVTFRALRVVVQFGRSHMIHDPNNSRGKPRRTQSMGLFEGSLEGAIVQTILILRRKPAKS